MARLKADEARGIADSLGRLAALIRSGGLTASTGMAYRLEGASVGILAVLGDSEALEALLDEAEHP